MIKISKRKPRSLENTFTEFLLYKTPNNKVKVEIFLRDENIWLTQEKIAALFGVQRPAVTKHLKNIFETGELKEEAVSSILELTASDDKKYQTKFYNLDAIISVGYRVNSTQATHFRIWATERLKEYIIKGFTMDDERLKDPRKIFGKDYFDEQLARIRDIRSSERRFYQKITDIYSQCSIDYDPENKETKDFFAAVQNKLHFAITGQTAAEIIHSRADNNKLNMGLTNWKNSPTGKIRKSDVSIAKNFLNEVLSTIKLTGEWYDESDAQVDYFNTAFYIDINIGRWNKPYVYNNQNNLVSALKTLGKFEFIVVA